jgi:hypothetical protein
LILPYLHWNETIVDGLINLIDKEIKVRNYSEETFEKKYYNYLKSVSNIIEENVRLAEEKASKQKEELEKKVNSKQIRIPKYDIAVRDELRQFIIDNQNKINEMSSSKGDGYDEEVKAFSLEKSGDVKNALIYYYVSVKKKFDAPALYKELSKLLHKNGLFDEEIYILDSALKNLNYTTESLYDNEFAERKLTVKRIIEKEKANNK